eukprot:1155446-Pelagomonas_calceolata.AAC.3
MADDTGAVLRCSHPRTNLAVPCGRQRTEEVAHSCAWLPSCRFPVADRANAVRKWLTAAEANPSMIKAPWLLLLESDYVWIKPLPVRDAWNTHESRCACGRRVEISN